METVLLYVIIALFVIVIVTVLSGRNKKEDNNLSELEKKINELQGGLITIDRALKDDFRISRVDSGGITTTNLQEVQK